MYQQRIAKHLIELNKMDFDSTFNTMAAIHTNSEQRFFRFVDKNPLFDSNSQEAIHEYLVSSRKRKFDYKSQIDENYEIPSVSIFTDDVCKG
jgi:hypothetical protein